MTQKIDPLRGFLDVKGVLYLRLYNEHITRAKILERVLPTAIVYWLAKRDMDAPGQNHEAFQRGLVVVTSPYRAGIGVDQVHLTPIAHVDKAGNRASGIGMLEKTRKDME